VTCTLDNTLLIAGGGGGGAGCGQLACITTDADGVAGGVAPATSAANVTGAGQNNFNQCAQCDAQGGSEPGPGLGGMNLRTSDANGNDGIGGEGGIALQSTAEIQDGVGNTGWLNGDPDFTVPSSGRGGNSDNEGGLFIAGCAGGGGGYGGGAGGNTIEINANFSPGAGGGSWATGVRVSCAIAPAVDAIPSNPGSPNGAVEIWFFTSGC